MSSKIGRIAQNEVRIAVKQAVALEQQRIESVSADLIDTVGGGNDSPTALVIAAAVGSVATMTSVSIDTTAGNFPSSSAYDTQPMSD